MNQCKCHPFGFMFHDCPIHGTQSYSEAEVRQLRDNIYGRTAEADKNWLACREHWMKPDQRRWLVDHQPKGAS